VDNKKQLTSEKEGKRKHESNSTRKTKNSSSEEPLVKNAGKGTNEKKKLFIGAGGIDWRQIWHKREGPGGNGEVGEAQLNHRGEGGVTFK